MHNRPDVKDLFGMLKKAARPRTNPRARALVKWVILPTIANAFALYPELDVEEILNLCAPALEAELRRELHQR